jgi:hypothetical protein
MSLPLISIITFFALLLLILLLQGMTLFVLARQRKVYSVEADPTPPTSSVASDVISGTVVSPTNISPPLDSSIPEAASTSRLNDDHWIGLVEECVKLFDELDRHSLHFDPASRDLAEHVESRLQEILERSGVHIIANETKFDRNRHQPERASGVSAGSAIAETLSPGFTVDGRVLRRARVRLTES